MKNSDISDRPTASWRRSLALACLRFGSTAAVVSAIAGPALMHYHVDGQRLTRKIVLEAQHSPDDAVLDEIGHMTLITTLPLTASPPTLAAEIAGGRMRAAPYRLAPLPLQGYPHDYRQGCATLQLLMASLEVERVLLLSYEQTHETAQLELALRRVRQFARHESRQRLPDAYLWNDHAVSARIAVLANLWRHLRHHPTLAAAAAPDLLGLVERSGHILANPANFTVRTNHGIVQNLALLQIGAAFPNLPQTAAWRALALKRLRLQLGFYVSPEGMVLEHSPEYHHFGTELLSYAVRLQVLNGQEADPALVSAATRARDILRYLQRPDGTLPLLGNTNTGSFSRLDGAPDGHTTVQLLEPPFQAPPEGALLQATAGYALWWQGGGAAQSQIVQTWAHHIGHGHKHADEGALQFWRGGQDWITNTGYWPYGAELEGAARGWASSNAPHQPGEAANVQRKVDLLGSGSAQGLLFTDLRRLSENGSKFRRQLMQLDDATLLVLDFNEGQAGAYQSIWTVPPPLQLRPASPGSYLSTEVNGERLSLSYAGKVRATVHRGQRQPFAGWVVVDHQPMPAHALLLGSDAPNSSVGLLAQVAAAGTQPPSLQLDAGASGEHWTARITVNDGQMLIRRDGARLAVHDGWAERALTIQTGPDTLAPQQALRQAYLTAVTSYPPWRDLDDYRSRLAMILACLALAVEVAWQISCRWKAPAQIRHSTVIHMAIVVGWLSVGWCALRIYLV